MLTVSRPAAISTMAYSMLSASAPNEGETAFPVAFALAEASLPGGSLNMVRQKCESESRGTGAGLPKPGAAPAR